MIVTYDKSILAQVEELVQRVARDCGEGDTLDLAKQLEVNLKHVAYQLQISATTTNAVSGVLGQFETEVTRLTNKKAHH